MLGARDSNFGMAEHTWKLPGDSAVKLRQRSLLQLTKSGHSQLFFFNDWSFHFFTDFLSGMPHTYMGNAWNASHQA
jgi:hypothetical protein